ncbi:non-ribosomal peptide synthase/polyketide synthase [Pseudomonas syringae pv. syringae]|uniref:Non-ribosomal peptide synthase/polyketide synthase n=2 Tax=Pseudomonas syringae TaxID=317 RepID=A0AB35JPW0_PSESY|nr:non-ribosomal peptide synthase/polyketide synthase [Pseudomonas syringae]MDC3735982.1 non-ribosomal peptide synthase/polyketide synthase [Pseudomonas syringae pv. syringae]
MDSSPEKLSAQACASHVLASVQQGIWLDQIAHPELPYYNIGMSLDIRGEINIPLFEKAIQMVVDSHDALRLSFSHADGFGRQQVLPEVRFTLDVVDFSEADDDAGLAMDYLRKSFQQPFESLNGQLWESRLVRCGPHHYYWFNRFHHLVVDGIGAVLVGHAVDNAYNGLLVGNEDVPEGPSYLSFLEEDRAYLQSGRYERDRLFWEQTYAQLPPSLLQRRADFKAGLANVLAPSTQVQAMLPRALYSALTKFASERSLSMAHLLVSVIGTYFCRTVGVDEIVVGMPVHNRTTARQKTTVGMFSSVSPIRLAFDPQGSLVELMNTVGTQLRKTYRHQRFPIAELNRSLHLAHAGRRQLFDVSLSFESFDGDATYGQSTPARVLMLDNGYEQTPMAIFVRDYHPAEDVHLDFNFNTAYFTFEEVQRIQERIFAMLEAVLEHHETPLAHFPLIGEDEHQHLLTFNDTAHAYPRDVLIHQLIEQQAAQRPNACAVSSDSGPLLTYAELNQQANQLAHRLIELGVEPDSRVAVSLRRGPEMVVALLGILKAGGAYVPIDPDLPSARQAYMLSDSAPRAVLTRHDLLDDLSALNSTVPVLVLDDHNDSAQLAAQPTGNPDAKVLGLQPNHLAYVLYTSGSTGTPKGVMNEHLGVVNRLLWARDAYQVDSSDRVLQKTPFGFDVSVWEFFLPLLAGAELVMARPGGHQEPDYLAQVMSDAGITLLHFVPSMLDLFLEHRSSCDFPQLRRVLCSGEALPRSLQRRFEQQLQGVELHNLYGPTEAAIDVTAWECRPTDPGESVPIGRPIANIQMHVLDALGQVQPLGVAGELHIGGIGVARGYLNQPELSAERFIADPFSGDPQARLYKTGDVGRWLANGALEYLGRNDFQVKIRGLRIEIGEIEAALALCAGVREVVVVARADDPAQPDSKHLVAYLCGEPAPAEQLRKELLKHLPEYMVPSAFVHLDSLPLTPNGKLDRKALPAPDLDSVISRGYEAPVGDIEVALVNLWQDLLDLTGVGRRDDFFELGGHSLLAVRLISQIRQQLGVELSLATLFAHPELTDLAQVIAQAGRSTLPDILPVARDQDWPLSFGQQRLWFLARMEGASAAYHMPASLSLRGALDSVALQRALQQLVARHEGLRTTFIQGADQQPLQRISPVDNGFNLQLHDLQGVPDAEHTLQALADEESLQPFDLEQGPLIRGRLIRMAEDHHVLLLTLHHIVSDGWSVGVLTREMAALYAAFSQGEESPLAPMPLQYLDYAVWQRRWLSGDLLQEQTRYWQQTLADAPALLMLPTDRVRPAQQDYAGAALPIAFDEQLTLGLKALSKRHGTTLYMTVISAWAALLGRLAGQDDVVIGSPVANRTRSEIEGLVGLFVNTLAIRVDLSDKPTAETLLARVKQQTLEAQAHQDLPFEQVVEVVKPVRSLAHSPVFQAMLTWQDTNDMNFVLGDLQLESLSPSNTLAKFDLSLDIGEAQGRLLGTLEYATALFDESTMARYLGYFQRLLEAMVADERQVLEQVPLLDAVEREHLLLTLNATNVPYPQDSTIHQLFEEKVQAQPNAIAVAFQAQRLSYAELNRQANCLAHHLIGLGIGADDRVAICVERGVEMMVGLLGVLKAGGAYVPLDPAYPAERLAYMIQDSTPSVVLTQRALQDRLPALAVPLVLLDDDQRDTFTERNDNPVVANLDVRNLAYVIYTSGSTGNPKGVMIEHRGLVNYSVDAARLFGLSPADTVLQQNTLNFDLSVEEIFPALLAGATLAPSRDIFGSEGSEDYGIHPTVLHLTAAHWHTLAAEWHSQPHVAAQRLQHVRLINVTGDALSAQKLKLWDEVRPAHTLLINTYGPTEATVSCTAAYVSHDAVAGSEGSGNATIGKPMANTRIYLLDAHQQPVPYGVAGEIFIGGDGVARGYLNLAEVNAERFLADPFSNSADARMYKTGDLARYMADGRIEYLGRNDFQVKVRGFRIELGEIETRLANCAGVKEAVVIAREDRPGDKRLVAYVVAKPQATLDAAGLRAELAPQLAEYMLPGAFVILDALPLTPNRKLDRKALPVPADDAYASRTYEAPLGEIEQIVAGVWQDLLGIEQVSRHDRFFELGGHSLLAVSLIDRLRKQGLNLSVSTVFTAPSVREMAHAISQNTQTLFHAPANRIPAGCTQLTPDMLPLVELSAAQIDLIAAAVPGGAANIQDIYPLAPLQQGILFHYLLDHEGDAYLVRSMIEFDSRARLDAFLEGLQTVIDRHDIMRSSVHWSGQPQAVQVVHRQAQLPVHTLTLTQEEDALSQLNRLTDPRHMRLDLQQAPLMRACIARDPHSECWLLALMDHHMISDHVTQEIVLEEVRLLMQGQGADLLPAQPYREFVAQTLVTPSEAHEAYFKRRLADVESPTAPFDLLEVQVDGNGIEEADVSLDNALNELIRAQARARGIAPAVLFHVAWAQVLARCTARDDVVFGTVVTGRLQGTAGAERAMGMFMNTLPVRMQLAAQGTHELVMATHRDLSELLAHEQAPLALAQRCSGVATTVPLFTTLLNYRHQGRDSRLQWPGLRLLDSAERTNYPLDLTVNDYGDAFSLMIHSVPSVEPQRLVAMMQSALEQLAEALAHAPDTAITQLDVLPTAERTRLLETFNKTTQDYPTDRCIHDLFEAQVEAQPDAIAVVFNAQRLSYAELNRQANRLAHHLIGLGIGPDDRVAICVERGVEMMVGLLGVLKAGAAYVPLDPHFPLDRLAYMLENSAPAVILTQHALHSVLPASSVPVLLLDPEHAECEGLLAQPDHNPLRTELLPEHLAYVIYTSGSTGLPKGVQVSHQALSNFLHSMQQQPGLSAHDRLLAITTISFDIAALELYLPLANGACVVLASRETTMDGVQLQHLLAEQHITVMQATPTTWQMLVNSGWAGKQDLRIFCGGEALPRSLARELLSRSSELWNLYGPTETTIWSCVERVDELGESVTVPIGRPIANTRLYLLDAQQRPVPQGVAGELYIGGAGVARGYLNRNDLTAERFLTDPFSQDPTARMYRTGDLGRYWADGTLEYLGRNDDQVKIRGFRIELGEIEARLVACPGVKEAVVIALEGRPGEKRLVAYVVAQPATTLDVAALRAELASHLAEYMLPSVFVMLDALPMTPNLKLDRKALPAPGADDFAHRQYEAPQGETEARLAAIWSDLLGMEKIGRHDNFFELGGHSLLTVQLQARLHQDIGVEINLRTLFGMGSLLALAECVEQTAQSQVQPIEVVPRTQDLPLSLAQQRLWFLDQLDHAASVAYHMPAALHLRGTLDRQALQRALDRIVARHESLRATFEQHNEKVSQRFAPETIGFALAEHDLRNLAGDAQQEMTRQLSEAEVHAAFDLSQGPLIRGRLLQLAEDEHILLVTQHHIVSDGWSVAILIDELNRLYSAFSQGLDDPLLTLALQYADYAVWQQQHLQGERLQQQTRFWSEHLSGAPALLELPTDHPRPQVQSYKGATLPLELPAQLSHRLRQFSLQQNVTPFMTLLAAWSILLSRLSNQPQVVIGTPVANRTRQETEALIGFFVNTLALHVDVKAHSRVDQLLAQVKAITLDAYSHQDLPFEQVVEALQPQRSLAHSPLFQAMLVLGNTPRDQALTLPGLELTALPDATATTQFDLTLSLNDDGESIHGRFEYATDLFDPSTITRWSRHLLQLLDALLSDVTQPLASLPLLDAEQRRQLLVTFNPPALPLDEHLQRLPQRAFEAQAALTPDAVALVCAGQTLSYAALNAEANRIAHRLIALGVRPDDTVGLCALRSPQMVIGLLGILKAGAAYVPLDPQYPAQRLTHMLTDSAPKVLVIQQGLDTLPLPEGLATLELGCPSLQHVADHNPQVAELNFGHLAYVIYTSGSTGLPKGVMVEHRGLRNLLDWYIDDLALNAEDAVLLASSYNFDLTQKNILAPLMVGAALHLAEEPFNPDAIVAQIAAAGITHLNMSPSAFHALVDADTDKSMACLKRVVLGGEPIQINMLEKLGLPRPTVINSYGPTECSDVVAWHVADSDLAIYHDRSMPIGKPIRNMQLHVLDDHGQLLPVGVRGEIHIGGVGVARGYLNLPQLSAERFVANPFADHADARLYKTGDIGRWLPDGTLEYLGRNDDQVKIRGLRVELGEIEAVLGSLPGVREAAVIARDHQSEHANDKRLVAYLCGEPAAAEQLRAELLNRLPEHMVPSAFVVLDALPLTPNGKLDRRALPEPGPDAYASRAYEAPEGPVEQVIAHIWEQLLGVERVGRHDRFFELGGHSLLAVSLIDRLRKHGLSAGVRTVFTAPSVREMALAISQDKHVLFQAPANRIPADCTHLTPDMLPLVQLSAAQLERVVAAVPGGAANIQDIYPLAPLQEGILFHHLLGQEGDAYLMRSMIEFDNRQHLDAFIAALQVVIERHDIHRTAVHWDGLPQAVQVVQRHAHLPIHSMTLDSDKDSLEQLYAMSDPQHLRLDLNKAPLMRACIARDPHSERWLLALLNHHVASDHVTLEVVLEEINAILHGQVDSLPAPQPYREFIAQTQAVPAEVHEAYFRRRLADVDATTAPFDLMEVQGDGNNIEEAEVLLSSTLSRRIRAQARERGMTPAVLFHVAWAQVLARCSGRDDVVFGTVVAGRLQGSAGAERAMGVFINTLPVRVQLAALGANELLLATHRDLTELLDHEQASLALAQRCSSVDTSAPLFTTLLNYRHQGDDSQLQWPGMRMLDSEERTNYPLCLSVNDYGNDLGLLIHSVEPVDPHRLCAMTQCALEQLTEALAHTPHVPLPQLDVLPGAERTLLVETFNQNRYDGPTDLCIQHLFEAQVRSQPDAIALVDAQCSLTYAELNARANRIAHRLIEAGLRPDERVALLVERSPEMIVGILAILKAGGAYVPLDPNYPQDRLQHMLDDSSPRVLLSQGRLTEELPALSIPNLRLEDAPGNDTNPQLTELNSRHLCYVMYTSGSTGKPKGVMVEHRSVCSQIGALQERYGLNPQDRVLQFATMTFDMSVEEIFGALLSGAALVLRSDAWIAGTAAFASLCEQYAITVANLPTVFWQQISRDADVPLPTCLRQFMIGGEAVGKQAVAQWFEREGHRPALFNAYGPTEATVNASIRLMERDNEDFRSIGIPVRNTQLYVLDSAGLPAPLGVAGELYIGGICVARGYLNRAELSAERFIADPFTNDPAARLYKTGDLARWRADGTLEYLGRNDDQVKIRGFRVELGEIEAVLGACAGVSEAVVVARESTPGQSDSKRLIAYLCGDPVPVEQLRAALMEALPDYMVPSAYVHLQAMPLTPNGKLDRLSLPAPGQEAFASRAYEAPQGEIEQIIADVWQELLGIEQVGRHDNFFELGGHSLLAVQVILRARETFGVEVPLRGLFEHPSLQALADLITTLQLAQYGSDDLMDLEHEMASLSESELLSILSKDA